MSCSSERSGSMGEEHNSKHGRKSVSIHNSIEDKVKLGSPNGSIEVLESSIDETLLVDPKSLFIGSKIGEGAHGKVYEGRYGDQIVAIKVLHRGKTPEERAALEGRFAREVNMMSRVKNKNLVRFIGACKDPLMVIVTELLPGMSLRKYLSSIRPEKLELQVVLCFAIDVAQAMDCLHANGIIHRDLKPGTTWLQGLDKIMFFFIR